MIDFEQFKLKSAINVVFRVIMRLTTMLSVVFFGVLVDGSDAHSHCSVGEFLSFVFVEIFFSIFLDLFMLSLDWPVVIWSIFTFLYYVVYFG